MLPDQNIPSQGKAGLVLLIILTAVIGLGLGASAAYLLTKKPAPVPVTDNNTATTTTDVVTGSVLTDKDIGWNTPVKIASLHIFSPDSTRTSFDSGAPFSREDGAEYYQVGKVTSGSYKDGDIILVSAYFEGPGGYPGFYHFIRQNNNLILLAKASVALDEYDNLERNKFTIDDKTTMPSLDTVASFYGPQPRENLTLDPYVNAMFDETQVKKLFNNPVVGDVYVGATQSTTTDMTLFQRNGFYVKAPDGTARVYSLKVDFVDDKNIPDITWNDGTLNTQQYTFSDSSGCGPRNYLSVISSSVINPATDLKKIGTNNRGDSIYELKNANHALLKDFYNNGYYPAQDFSEGKPTTNNQKMPYSRFVTQRPLIFWIDPFGRTVKFTNSSFQPMAECGKPVIYLYPPKTTTVQVKVEPKGGLTYSEPVYGNGWTVKATPSGALTEISTGKNYPYLFWEGRGGIYQQPKRGFVVSRADVPEFLHSQLTALGLVDHEITDFSEFWLPRMNDKPYYFISFLGTRAMDQLAPLSIEPKPDSVLRILMDYTPLDRPIKVEGYSLPTPPARTGFSVVEWGGVIR